MYRLLSCALCLQLRLIACSVVSQITSLFKIASHAFFMLRVFYVATWKDLIGNFHFPKFTKDFANSFTRRSCCWVSQFFCRNSFNWFYGYFLCLVTWCRHFYNPCTKQICNFFGKPKINFFKATSSHEPTWR